VQWSWCSSWLAGIRLHASQLSTAGARKWCAVLPCKQTDTSKPAVSCKQTITGPDGICSPLLCLLLLLQLYSGADLYQLPMKQRAAHW
jgi:hypothetical protein